jgi:hypothetical protein
VLSTISVVSVIGFGCGDGDTADRDGAMHGAALVHRVVDIRQSALPQARSRAERARTGWQAMRLF